ncbi:raftlin [Mus pahari]|uniref:raftlin n=1 Tax=Mus pahari TaxID=10093 RepID=UPI000A30CAFB|nr:raftlin [Mus pahari]XP_029387357.1 raftlin [Mus pahari]XP_029387358.1 raftlin [Mus pahari]XP_029387359.1 raftlin [Mus pahari]
MGCSLNKLEKREEKRPGNIYSTLKRPQVETKIDVTYEYCFLEFTTLTAAELPRSSATRLASLRDLPDQLLELYQQGFSLAALHPFVQPTHRQEKILLEHIFRAILVKKTNRSQKAELHNEGYILELDYCSSLEHLADQKLIPEFIKKVQEAASRGLKFVSVVPQYQPSVSSAGSRRFKPVANSAEDARDVKGTLGDRSSLDNDTPKAEETDAAAAGVNRRPEPNPGSTGEVPSAQQPGIPSPSAENEAGEFPLRGLQPARDGSEGDPSNEPEELPSRKMEIFAFFNRPKSQQKCRQYYPVTIPLQVSKNGQTVSSLDASWLEHMSDHFRKGGVLVNAVFQLGMANDSFYGLTDGVFIFEAVSTEESRTTQGYDAIVVEQWTVLEGTEVQTDYMPLLNSLAAYGWQLTCVLPTPILKTTREGNVSTKQIVFLQRPCLPQKTKKREPKFQWRFSRNEIHGRQTRKSKGKLSASDKQQAEENEKNLEDQFSKAGDVGNCVLGPPPQWGRASEVREQRQGSAAVQNGPAGHNRDSVALRHSDPRAEAELAAGPAPTEAN